MNLEPSNIAAFYLEHEQAMKNCSELEEAKSFAISPKGNLSLQILQDLAAAQSVGKKCFIVAEWDEAFEVQRLPDGTNRQLLLKYVHLNTTTKAPALEKPVEEVRATILNYQQSDLKEARRYDSELSVDEFKEMQISYAYIQRRNASKAAFRRHKDGATVALKAAIKELVDTGVLQTIAKEGRAMYKIIKGSENEN